VMVERATEPERMSGTMVMPIAEAPSVENASSSSGAASKTPRVPDGMVTGAVMLKAPGMLTWMERVVSPLSWRRRVTWRGSQCTTRSLHLAIKCLHTPQLSLAGDRVSRGGGEGMTNVKVRR
jgi:hypothetical protein